MGGKQIKLFLIDDTPGGLTTAELTQADHAAPVFSRGTSTSHSGYSRRTAHPSTRPEPSYRRSSSRY